MSMMNTGQKVVHPNHSEGLCSLWSMINWALWISEILKRNETCFSLFFLFLLLYGPFQPARKWKTWLESLKKSFPRPALSHLGGHYIQIIYFRPLAFLARLTESNYREAWALRGVEGGVRDEGGGGGQLDLVTALLGLLLLLLLLAIIFPTCESGHPRDASRASRPCLRHCAWEVKRQIACDQGEPISSKVNTHWTTKTQVYLSI